MKQVTSLISLGSRFIQKQIFFSCSGNRLFCQTEARTLVKTWVLLCMRQVTMCFAKTPSKLDVGISPPLRSLERSNNSQLSLLREGYWISLYTAYRQPASDRTCTKNCRRIERFDPRARPTHCPTPEIPEKDSPGYQRCWQLKICTVAPSIGTRYVHRR